MHLFIFLIAGLCFASSSGMAAEKSGWQCWQDAAEKYSVPVELLYSVARVETNNRASITSKPNNNGTYDIGLMQINSAHLPMLRKYGITKEILLREPCVNLHIGAWIMSMSIARYGYNWRGVGAYNAGNEYYRKIYARKVMAMYERITKEKQKEESMLVASTP